MNDEQLHFLKKEFYIISKHLQSISESLIVFTGIYECIADSLYKMSDHKKILTETGELNEKIKSRKKN